MSILFALLGAFSQALTSVLQRLANVAGADEKRSVWQTTMFLVRQPMWLLGMVCMGGTFVFTALALYFGTLATVQPILVTELIFTLALRALWLHDRIATRTWGAAALLCAGLFGFLVVAHPQEGHGHPTPDRVDRGPGQPGPGHRGPLDPQPLGIAGPAGRPARSGRRSGVGHRRRLRQGRHRGAGPRRLGRPVRPLAGLCGGGQWGARHRTARVGVRRRPLAASQSALLIVDPLASIAIGVELFGEQLNSSPVAIVLQVVFLAAMFAGVVLLSKWAPPEMEARAKRSPRLVAPAGAVPDPI